MSDLLFQNVRDELGIKPDIFGCPHEFNDLNVLSERLKDTYDIFGSLPETIDDDWIDDEETLREKMDEYMHERDKAQNAFSVKYRSSVDPDAHKWEYCSKVLSRRDIYQFLAHPWR